MKSGKKSKQIAINLIGGGNNNDNLQPQKAGSEQYPSTENVQA